MRSIVIVSSMNLGTREFRIIWNVDSVNRSKKSGEDIIEIDCGKNSKIFVLNGVAFFRTSEKKKKDLIQLFANGIRNHCIEAGNWNRILLFHGDEEDMYGLINILTGIQFQKSKIYHHSPDDSGFYKDYIIPFKDAKGTEGELFERLWRNVISENEQIDFPDVENENKTIQSIIHNFLSSLDILLQGYLIIRNPKAILGGNFTELMENYGILNKGSDQKEEAIQKTAYFFFPDDQRLFRPSNIEGTPCRENPSGPQNLGWFWFDECLTDIGETSYTALTEKCEIISEKIKLKELWNLIRGECLGKPDGISIEENCKGWTQDDFTNLFECAHKEYISIFEQTD
jgi:hypothetical protein